MPYYPELEMSRKKAKKLLKQIKKENRQPFYTNAFPALKIIHRELVDDPGNAGKKMWNNYTLEHLYEIAKIKQ